MKLITVCKNKETDKAVNLQVFFWVDNWDFWIYKWLPKSVVKFTDETHAEVTDWALSEIIKEIAAKHSFNKARYNARFYPENIRWEEKTDDANIG